jgi:hypothetical protein
MSATFLSPMNNSSPAFPLRTGVIGTGFIGPVHVEALRRVGVTVTAICDVGDLATKAAARLAIPRAFSDYREMLACPEIDAVHITTPNRFHCEMSLAALAAGKHVVCEKPLAMNTAETARIVKADRALKSGDVIKLVQGAIRQHVAPEYIRSDNGSEFIAKELQHWLAEAQIRTIYIEPGSPWQNGFVESFHGRFRDECLNREQLWSLTEARVVIEDYRNQYNQQRPHSRLGYRSPAQYAASLTPSLAPGRPAEPGLPSA